MKRDVMQRDVMQRDVARRDMVKWANRPETETARLIQRDWSSAHGLQFAAGSLQQLTADGCQLAADGLFQAKP